jgi:formylglycine-generating enzyme required for sulfatase activity
MIRQSNDSHVLRGGSWLNSPDLSRSAFRNDHPPDFCNYFSGFRIVLLPQDDIQAKSDPVNKANQTKKDISRQTPKKPDLLDCTGSKGADEKTVQAAQKAWANYLEVKVQETVELGDGVKMEFVLIPPGKFLMGATKEEQEEYMKTVSDGKRPEFLDWELPQHEVTITKPLYMGKYEVTQQEYTTLMKLSNPSYFSEKGGAKERVQGKDTKRYPVESVSWENAKKYWELLSKQNLPKKVKMAFLPTESQWEYACRAGTRTAFHFGDALNGKQANCNGNYPFGTSTKGPYLERPVEVDSRTDEAKECRPNAFGLHHMHGNVWEWCLDGFHKRGYEVHKKEDPFLGTLDNNFVLRGGSWNDSSISCSSASRYYYSYSFRNACGGFRIVLLFEES